MLPHPVNYFLLFYACFGLYTKYGILSNAWMHFQSCLGCRKSHFFTERIVHAWKTHSAEKMISSSRSKFFLMGIGTFAPIPLKRILFAQSVYHCNDRAFLCEISLPKVLG